MSRLLSAGAPVNHLPQNVGVTIVTGHLLDHVAQDPGEGLPAAWPPCPIL